MFKSRISHFSVSTTLWQKQRDRFRYGNRMGVPQTMEALRDRAASMRDSLHKSQAFTDSMVAILGSFDHRLSALETAMRPTQVIFLPVCLVAKKPLENSNRRKDNNVRISRLVMLLILIRSFKKNAFCYLHLFAFVCVGDLIVLFAIRLISVFSNMEPIRSTRHCELWLRLGKLRILNCLLLLCYCLVDKDAFYSEGSWQYW